MKFLRPLLVSVLFLTIASSSYVMAQCTGGTQNGTLDPITTSFQFFTTGVANQYQTFTAVFGEQYEFSYCNADGGASPDDTEINIVDNGDVFVGFAAGGYSDDDCGGGVLSHTVFTPSMSGTYRVLSTDLSLGCNVTGVTTWTLAYRSVVLINVEENSPIENIKISPNPTTGMVAVTMEDFHAEDLNITITDITGRVAINEEDINVDGRYTANYDLSSLTKGMYLLMLNTGDKTRTEKIILQ